MLRERWGLDVNERQVGVLGATSLVGACLLPVLTQAGWHVTAYSRCAVSQAGDGVAWRQLPGSELPSSPPSFQGGGGTTPYWVCVAPIWTLPEHFALLEAQGARRVVVLSSTSRFTKDNSSNPEEQAVARRLAEAEARVQAWAENRGVEWVILRPTLIYGLGRDKNITEIARFIRRFGFFPLFGKANGLRQPIHAEDVATACLAALQAPAAANHAYNLSGGETLAYRDMVARVFSALGRRPRLMHVPLSFFRVAIVLLRCFPRYREWSAAMAVRMNVDLLFDHTPATHDFAFKPRGFVLTTEDMPSEPGR